MIFCVRALLIVFVVLVMALPVRAVNYTVLAFGDSITQGLHRNASGMVWGVTSVQYGTRRPLVNGDDGYEPVLEQLVRNASEGRNTAFVYNWGYQGERTYTGVNRIDGVLASRTADFILIMEGANDLYQGVSPETTKFNIGVMADKALAKDVLPILGGVTPNTNHPNGSIVWKYYYPLIYTAAYERGIPFVDMYNPFAGTAGERWPYFNSGDGLHLNSTGYRYMAGLWYAELGKLLYSGRDLPWLPALLLKKK